MLLLKLLHMIDEYIELSKGITMYNIVSHSKKIYISSILFPIPKKGKDWWIFFVGSFYMINLQTNGQIYVEF